MAGCGNELAKHKEYSLEERRKQIFAFYVEQMFQRIGSSSLAFPKEKSIGWLSWLAGKMREHSQTVFLVEGLQPSWLDTRAKRLAYGTTVALTIGLIFGLVCGLTGGLMVGLKLGLTIGLKFGLIIGLVFALTGPIPSSAPKRQLILARKEFFGFVLN